MVEDVLGSLLAVVTFACILYAPGYVSAFALNLFGFRRRDFAEQSFWAVACSFSISPIAAHLVGRVFGLSGVCVVYALFSLGAIALIWKTSAFTTWSSEHRQITFLVGCGWTLLVLALMLDLQVGHRLYYSVVMADESYRIAFTDAVVRTGIPPANPLYFAHMPATMHYYYFWYVLCAAVVKVAHVSSRQAFVASCVWAGFGLICAVRLYASHFFAWTRKTTWWALGLLLVTGADLLPALGNAVLQPSVNGDTEWWSVDPIDAWPDSLLWVPHHVASVLCCLFAFLVMWTCVMGREEQRSHSAIIIAAAACASALGLSVFVAMGFAFLMTAWLTRVSISRSLSRKSWWSSLGVTVCLCFALALPFVRELLSGSATATQGIGTPAKAHLLGFSVRPMIDSGLLTSLAIFARWNQSHPLLLDQSVRLLLLLPGLAMELGVYGAVLVFLLIAWRRREPALTDQPRQTALFFCVIGLLLTMFVSSAVITNNDFGYRAVMLPQFFLTLLTADVLSSWQRGVDKPVIRPGRYRRRIVLALLILGVAGTCYWAVLMRAWLPVEAAQTSSGFIDSPDDAFQVRDAFDRLDRIAPRTAVVAFRDMDLDAEREDMEVMTPTEYFQRMLVMDTGRQILNAERKCATHFGGDATACSSMKEATQHLYASPAPTRVWALQYCKQFGVQYLTLSVRDEVWNDAAGWPVDLPVVVHEPRLEVVQCAEGSIR